MEKMLTCVDLGLGCDFVFCANTEEEISQQAVAHARAFHNMTEFPKEFFDKVHSAIREVEECYQPDFGCC